MNLHPSPEIRHAAWNIWQNPIFRRYCQSRLRPRGIGITLIIVLLLAGFITAITSSFGLRGTLTASDTARIGAVALLGIQCIILFILGTAQVAGGMTAERDEGVIDYQRLIPMSPLAKVVGYLFGLPVREYVLFLATLPFTAWSLWKGGVSHTVWLPLYGVVLSSTLLYHFTGLLTGTVVKNRRWAFLASIGLVFCLYTVIPGLANYGLVFFKYLTVSPVLWESLPGMLPATAGAVVSAKQQLLPTAKFFNLDFSEVVFTLFSQGGLILTFIVMLCRKWRRTESHLLGKAWAAGFFIWIQLLLLGNALPLINPGTLFPSRGFTRMTGILPDWAPKPGEAVLMSGLYGLASLILMLILTSMITPTTDTQLRGWRRARKLEKSSLPTLGDASTSFWMMLAMALAGAAGWFVFSRALVESHWFPGNQLGHKAAIGFTLLMLAIGTAYQSLLESKGGRAITLAAIFIGVVPLMIGAVLSVISNNLISTAYWVFGLSPATMPFYASGTLLPISDLPESAQATIPNAFHFWLVLTLLLAISLLSRLWSTRKKISLQIPTT